jgi:hypothetical protein
MTACTYRQNAGKSRNRRRYCRRALCYNLPPITSHPPGSPMPDKKSEIDDDRNYSHLLTLLSVSAAMVGVCLTAIGLVSVIKALNEVEHIVDELLAVATILFSCVTMLSFLGIRTPIRKRFPRYMLLLDILFCFGIGGMLIASMMLSFVVM